MNFGPPNERPTHHYYIVPGIVDGQKCHEDAQRRLNDKRDPGESVVHKHAHRERCNEGCVHYKFGRNDAK